MEEEDEDRARIGGYDADFVDELPPSQTCRICLLAMRSPVQTVCGHRWCESCLFESFKGDHDVPICPQDRNPLPEDGGVFRDVAWEREILSLRVKCNKSDRGCEWIGQLRYYEQEHLVFCKYADVKCHGCKEEMQRRLLHKHTTSECPKRMVQCDHCEEMVAFCDTKGHEDMECTRFPVKCHQECGEEEIPREEVESHVRDHCLNTIVECRYREVGCIFRDQRRHLKAHLEASTEEHLSKTWSELKKTTQRLDGLEGVLHDKEEVEHMNSAEISDLRHSKKELKLENKRLWNSMKGLRDEIRGLRDEITGLRDGIKNKDEVEEQGRVKSPAHRIYSAVVRLRTGAGKNRRKHANEHVSANVDTDDLYDEVYEEMYQ